MAELNIQLKENSCTNSSAKHKLNRHLNWRPAWNFPTVLPQLPVKNPVVGRTQCAGYPQEGK